MPELAVEEERIPLGAELIFPLLPVFDGVGVPDGPRAPVRLAGRRVWLVTRYDDARAVLAHSRIAKDVHRATALYNAHTGHARPVIGGSIAAHLLNVDPADHTRLRRLVVGAFTDVRLRALRAHIEARAHELLDGLAGQRRIDLIADFSLPLTLSDTCQLLGVPAAQTEPFQRWATGLLGLGSYTAAEADEVAADMAAYLATLLAAKRAEPGDDLLTTVIHAHQAGDLGDDELIGMTYVLSVAGFATSMHLIANGVLALLRHPDQFARLRADPGLLPGAVEEILRWAGPVGMSGVRFTTAPVRLGGAVIPEGEFVLVSLRAANRDDACFADPTGFDITRTGPTHLAFGHGVHRCVGAPLGRLEAEAALGVLLRRCPDLALAVPPEDLVQLGEPLVNNLVSLPVLLTGERGDA